MGNMGKKDAKRSQRVVAYIPVQDWKVSGMCKFTEKIYHFMDVFDSSSLYPIVPVHSSFFSDA
jgi:hypothetical protein